MAKGQEAIQVASRRGLHLFFINFLYLMNAGRQPKMSEPIQKDAYPSLVKVSVLTKTDSRHSETQERMTVRMALGSNCGKN
jgi:hypothetical protein